MLGNMDMFKDNFSDKIIMSPHHSFISNKLLKERGC